MIVAAEKMPRLVTDRPMPPRRTVASAKADQRFSFQCFSFWNFILLNFRPLTFGLCPPSSVLRAVASEP